MDTAYHNDSSLQLGVQKSYTTCRDALGVTLDMTIAERFNYGHQLHMAFFSASSVVLHNPLSYFPRIHLMQLPYFSNTLRSTITQQPYIPYVLLRHSANRHYDHTYNSAQCVMSTMNHKLLLRPERHSYVLTVHSNAFICSNSTNPRAHVL